MSLQQAVNVGGSPLARTVPDDESNVCKLGHADIFSLIVTISRRFIFGRHLNGIEACAAVARLGTNVIYRNLGIVLLGVVALNQGINAIAVTDEDFMTAGYGLAQDSFNGIIERIDLCGTGNKDFNSVL